MSKVDEYIQNYTRNCSNEEHGYLGTKFYAPWLTPDHARAVAEIAREELIDVAVEYLKEHKEAVETEDNGIIGWIPDYFIEDFKKHLEESV